MGSVTPLPRSRKILAVFDLDKTIIDTSASMAYRRPMAQRGLISTGEVLRMMTLLGSYMLTSHTEENMESTKEALLSMIKDRDSAAVRTMAEEALQEVITPFIYAEARDFLEEHKKLGHTIAIITASASVLVEPIARELGADILIATELEEKDGKFTGKVVHFNKGKEKMDRLLRLAKEGGYDLSRSFAYSDSATDLPMLEAVGYPHAVNPDRTLRRIATERDWPIEVFQRPEPLFDQSKVIASAGTLAILGAVATGLTIWLKGRAS